MDVLKVALDCMGENNSNGPRSSEISQWTSLARTLKASDLPGLDKSLTTRSYLVGNALSIADAAVYVALMTKEVDVTGYKNISRFVLHIQNSVKAVRGVKALSPSTRPTFIPSSLMAAVVAAPTPKKDTTTASAADGGKDKEADQGKKGKKEKKEKEGVSSSAPAPAPAPAADADLNPSLLDIRVGEVVKCWNHPDSEKLLCEEVDLGEATGPRNIASGIREFYSAEEFMGKKVMVLANLKDRNIANFKSQGMVLCACTDDKSKVKLLEPPAGANKGDKVEFAGAEPCDPATGSQMAKKKILEKLAPLLKTDDKGTAMAGKHAMKIREGYVTSQVSSAAIS